VETIKRQAKLRSVGWSACERRLSIWPMPYASLACDMTSASEVAVAAWGVLQVLYAFAFVQVCIKVFVYNTQNRQFSISHDVWISQRETL